MNDRNHAPCTRRSSKVDGATAWHLYFEVSRSSAVAVINMDMIYSMHIRNYGMVFTYRMGCIVFGIYLKRTRLTPEETLQGNEHYIMILYRSYTMLSTHVASLYYPATRLELQSSNRISLDPEI